MARLWQSPLEHKLTLIYATLQTHTTPVLLGFKDRAELAGADFVAASSVMEGVVIVEKVEQPVAPANGNGK